MGANGHPAIMVKDMILARSGVYEYTYDDMIRRGAKLKTVKPIYKEYRPADVIVRNKDKFAFSVITKEHTEQETNENNFPLQASGVVGEHIDVISLDNGEIALKGKGAFYTKDAFDYYKNGKRETSADYRSIVIPSDKPEYDFILKDILSVNGIAITEKGRGGSQVRVLDSLKKDTYGGSNVKKHGVLKVFGIGKPKDDKFKLSGVLMDNIRTFDSLEKSKQDTAIKEVMEHVRTLDDSEDKELLVSAITDAFSYPKETLEKEKEVSSIVDKLYTRCTDAEISAIKKKLGDAVDAADDGSADDGDADGGDADNARTKDSVDISGQVQKALDGSIDSIAQRVVDSMKDVVKTQVDEAVKKALGVNDDNVNSRSVDSVLGDLTDDDGSFLLNTSLGGR